MYNSNNAMLTWILETRKTLAVLVTHGCASFGDSRVCPIHRSACLAESIAPVPVILFPISDSS